MCFSKQKISQDFLNSLNFSLNSNCLEIVSDFKYLGIFFESNLSFEIHYNAVNSKISVALFKIRSIKRFLTCKAFQMIYNALVLPISDYCIEIWCVQNSSKLNIIQSKLNRLIYEYFISSKIKNYKFIRKNPKEKQILLDLFLEYQKFTIVERQQKFILKRVFKCFYGFEKCNTISDWFNFSESNGRRFPLLHVPHHNSEIFKKSFRYRSCLLWNSLRSFAIQTSWKIEENSYNSAINLIDDWILSIRANPYYYY